MRGFARRGKSSEAVALLTGMDPCFPVWVRPGIDNTGYNIIKLAIRLRFRSPKIILSLYLPTIR